MPATDIAVLLGILTGTPALVWRLRRGGLRGWRLARSGWIGFTGVVLGVSMAAHCADVLSRWYVGAGYDGTPWTYGFRVYSLLLLGGLLLACGVRLVRAAPGLGGGDPAAHTRALHTTLLVLALVVPLLPVHAFFAIPLTTLMAVSLPVLLWRRAPAGAAELPAPAV